MKRRVTLEQNTESWGGWKPGMREGVNMVLELFGRVLSRGGSARYSTVRCRSHARFDLQGSNELGWYHGNLRPLDGGLFYFLEKTKEDVPCVMIVKKRPIM